jgi:hypothetical protein
VIQLGTAGWLRAGVLGANDAIVSVAAVMARIFLIFLIYFSNSNIKNLNILLDIY